MKSFREEEMACEYHFSGLGRTYHLWTPENFEVIFTCGSDYCMGMNIFAIAAKLFPELIFLTYEIMSNHFHATVTGDKERIEEFFRILTLFLTRWSRGSGRTINWKEFKVGIRELKTLDDVRNVIAYNNRNGFLINPDETPFSYPWGANRFYFNSAAVRIASLEAKPMTIRDRQRCTHSRMADSITDILMCNGYALPLSFCDIESGERLFRNASQYFYKISRNIESQKNIAGEISESIFYTDDELYGAVYSLAKTRYGTPPSLLSSENKMEMATIMKQEYHASSKQIQRILRLDGRVIDAIYPSKCF